MFIQQQYLQFTGREDEIAFVGGVLELLREAKDGHPTLDAAIARLVKYHDSLEAQSRPRLALYDPREHG